MSIDANLFSESLSFAGFQMNGETVLPFFTLCMSNAWNGLAMGALDIAKKHLTRKAHGDIGIKIAEYPIVQVRIGVTDQSGAIYY